MAGDPWKHVAPRLTEREVRQMRERVDRIAQPLALALLVWLMETPDSTWRHGDARGSW